jgi:hypothetical protein
VCRMSFECCLLGEGGTEIENMQSEEGYDEE